MWLQLIKVRFFLSTLRLFIIFINNINIKKKFIYLNIVLQFELLPWLNYFREGFLFDQITKLIINNVILFWIINGAQFFNFNWINRLLLTYYYNNIFLIIYFNILYLIQTSLLFIFWKLGIIIYSSLGLLILLFYLI